MYVIIVSLLSNGFLFSFFKHNFVVLLQKIKDVVVTIKHMSAKVISSLFVYARIFDLFVHNQFEFEFELFKLVQNYCIKINYKIVKKQPEIIGVKYLILSIIS